MNEGGIVAACTQRAQAAGRKMVGLAAAGPTSPPTRGPVPAQPYLGTRPYTGLLRLKYRIQLSYMLRLLGPGEGI